MEIAGRDQLGWGEKKPEDEILGADAPNLGSVAPPEIAVG